MAALAQSGDSTAPARAGFVQPRRGHDGCTRGGNLYPASINYLQAHLLDLARPHDDATVVVVRRQQ